MRWPPYTIDELFDMALYDPEMVQDLVTGLRDQGFTQLADATDNLFTAISTAADTYEMSMEYLQDSWRALWRLRAGDITREQFDRVIKERYF